MCRQNGKEKEDFALKQQSLTLLRLRFRQKLLFEVICSAPDVAQW